MNRSSSLVAALVFMAVLAVRPVAAPADEAAPLPAPHAEVTPMTFDVGTVDDATKSKAVFTIKNTGNAELDILDVRPTCGCTVANLSSKKIAPGGQATLEAVYDPHNANGQVHRYINVRTNDPKLQAISLGITANVTPLPAPQIALSIYNVQGITLAAGKTDTREIKVTNNGEKDLNITEITNSPGITSTMDGANFPAGKTTQVALTLKPGETKILGVTVSPKVSSGFFSEMIIIRSNAKRIPAATFVEQGMVQG